MTRFPTVFTGNTAARKRARKARRLLAQRLEGRNMGGPAGRDGERSTTWLYNHVEKIFSTTLY